MEPDSVEVAPSEENGNLPIETPSEPPAPETPAEIVETVPEPIVEKFKLPDGREVTGEELYKEHVENLLPEFTKRSQELAALKQAENLNKPPESPYANPDYVPKSYEELLQIAEERALAKVDERTKAAEDAKKEVEDGIISTLTELRTSDPTLDENALFLHANKYQFGDLKLAHENMKAMSTLAKNVQQTTAKNIAKRNDPVSVTPGAIGAKTDPSRFATAVEYLRSLKN